eukprot:COSAG06_NODE_6062_length_3130_cov_2.108545_6_plen_44_part_01
MEMVRELWHWEATNVYHVNSGDASGNVTSRKVLRDVKYHLLLKS